MRRRSQAERIERASRPSRTDGHTLASATAELQEALRELARTLLDAVRIRL